MAQIRLRTSKIGLKQAQMAQIRLRTSKIGPKWLKSGSEPPEWAQDRTKSGSEPPKWAQNGPNQAQNLQIGPKWPNMTDFVDGRTYVRTDVLTFLTLTQVEPENFLIL